MVQFLNRLASGELLSRASTQRLLSIMKETSTGLDRLRAGIPNGWSIEHKTGTGREWVGVTSATNDVGVLTAPDGGRVAVAVFVAESRGSSDARAALIASVAKVVTGAYSRMAKSK
jgi:beta-lactamase class A